MESEVGVGRSWGTAVWRKGLDVVVGTMDRCHVPRVQAGALLGFQDSSAILVAPTPLSATDGASEARRGVAQPARHSARVHGPVLRARARGKRLAAGRHAGTGTGGQGQARGGQAGRGARRGAQERLTPQRACGLGCCSKCQAEGTTWAQVLTSLTRVVL